MDPKAPTQEEPGRAPKKLRAASVPLLDWNTCKNANDVYQEMVTETMTCAGYMTGIYAERGREGERNKARKANAVLDAE